MTEILLNNRDLHYAKKEYGTQVMEKLRDNSPFVEYCMLLSGRFIENLDKILTGKVESNDKIKRDNEKYENFLFSPAYSDKSNELFVENGIRNLTLFQFNSGFSKITLLLNKAISIDLIKEELSFIRNTLNREVSFLVDANISKKKMSEILIFLKENNINFFRLRWRGKKPTFRKLLLVKEHGNFKVSISNLNTNLGISERKTGKRIAVLALLNIFRSEIMYMTRGVSHPVGGDYPIYEYNHENWSIDLTEYSPNESDYIESRINLIRDLNEYAESYYSKVDSKQFAEELKRREIEIF